MNIDNAIRRHRVPIFLINLGFLITYFSLASQYVALQKYVGIPLIIFFIILLIVLKISKSNSLFGRSVKRKEFTQETKDLAYKRQRGICGGTCGQRPQDPEYHHINSRGDNSLENCLMMCPNCHARITKEEKPYKRK